MTVVGVWSRREHRAIDGPSARFSTQNDSLGATMPPIELGSPAPSVIGVPPVEGPHVLFFHKVTCPVCQMAAPPVQRFSTAYPGRVFGVGQDPATKLAAFRSNHGVTFEVTEDPPPYPASVAYGIRVVPTLVLVDGGRVVDLVESWDREGLNGLSTRLASMLGADYRPISEPGDGLPPFRPG
jgi:peroxiredoxin